jgi:hypothetical protein
MMTEEEALELARIQEDNSSFYMRSFDVTCLLRPGNVDAVLGALQEPFRQEYIEFAREAWLGDGPRITIGRSMPDGHIDVMKRWLHEHGLGTRRQHDE